MKNVLKGSIFYVIIAIIVVLGINYIRGNLVENTGVTYSQFQKYVAQNKVSGVEIRQNSQGVTGELTIHMKQGENLTLDVSDVTKAEELLDQKQIPYRVTVEKESIFMTTVLPMLLICVIFMVFFTMGSRQATGGNARMMNFGKSRATLTMPDNSKVTFKDVAGLQEEKEDLQEIVDFLKEPKKYLQVGARIPKGVLPKAVAGEAGVPFFSISGSDFVEMFVGVGASRVRDMFTEAKLHAPCIIFIDEIDAVARRRGAGVGGGHDEREQTLNQMLVEMDGFGYNEGIIVMAATNRVDILDPAILRPGRFDRKIGVGRPDVRGREEILAVHIKNKPLGEDVDLKEIARTSAGFTGADLENLMNEAAIYAAKAKRAYIMQEDIRRAFIKVGIGEEKKSRIISEKEKKITAYHEAGHAILFHVLPDMGPVHTISVIPTGMGAAGYTMPLPGEDEMFNSKKKMLQNIIVDFGGRVAEELIFGDVTTGASQDIKQATQMARAMVTQYGMSDKVGLIHYGSDDDEVFIGRDLAHTKGYADQTAALIDGEVKNIIDESYAKAKELLQEHMDVLHRCAQLLIEKEKIGREEFESLFGENA